MRSLAELRRRLEGEIDALDRAISAAVAGTPTPTLDKAMTWLSNAANNSKLWVATAATLALVDDQGRHAAISGLVAVGLTSVSVNVAAKRVFPRLRPERPVPDGEREVKLPTSSSFPSGHTASAFAFATVVGAEVPKLSLPLHGLAAAIAWSRVHTGVHYPSDVVAGAAIGVAIGTGVRRLR